MSGRLDQRQVVALLDVDPDLGDDVPPPEFALARRRAVAAVTELEPPDWDTSGIAADSRTGWLGLLLFDGLILRSVNVGHRSACEMFGPGDLVRPWDTDGEYAPFSISVQWRVLRPSRLAVLDAAFVLRTARWPSIIARIVGRVAQRARYLALTQAVTHLPRAYARLLILFWLLGERWGTMSPRGVHVTLPVTHEVLAMLIGARRPTVTVALQRLTRAGYLIRESSDHWLLTTEALERLSQPESMELVDDRGDAEPTRGGDRAASAPVAETGSEPT